MKSPGVFVEGNSFSEFVHTDHFVMVRLAATDKIKSSARRLMNKATAIYISDATDVAFTPSVPIPSFTPLDLPSLIDALQRDLE